MHDRRCRSAASSGSSTSSTRRSWRSTRDEHALADRGELLARAHAVDRRRLHPGGDLVLEAHHAHLEELVDHVGEDRDELAALEDRQAAGRRRGRAVARRTPGATVRGSRTARVRTTGGRLSRGADASFSWVNDTRPCVRLLLTSWRDTRRSAAPPSSADAVTRPSRSRSTELGLMFLAWVIVDRVLHAGRRSAPRATCPRASGVFLGGRSSRSRWCMHVAIRRFAPRRLTGPLARSPRCSTALATSRSPAGTRRAPATRRSGSSSAPCALVVDARRSFVASATSTATATSRSLGAIVLLLLAPRPALRREHQRRAPLGRRSVRSPSSRSRSPRSSWSSSSRRTSPPIASCSRRRPSASAGA